MDSLVSKKKGENNKYSMGKKTIAMDKAPAPTRGRVADHDLCCSCWADGGESYRVGTESLACIALGYMLYEAVDKVGVLGNTEVHRRNTGWECTGADNERRAGTHRETHWCRKAGNGLKFRGTHSGE